MISLWNQLMANPVCPCPHLLSVTCSQTTKMSYLPLKLLATIFTSRTLLQRSQCFAQKILSRLKVSSYVKQSKAFTKVFASIQAGKKIHKQSQPRQLSSYLSWKVVCHKLTLQATKETHSLHVTSLWSHSVRAEHTVQQGHVSTAILLS